MGDKLKIIDYVSNVDLYLWKVVFRDSDYEGDPITTSYFLSSNDIGIAANALESVIINEFELDTVVSMQNLGHAWIDLDYVRRQLKLKFDTENTIE